MSFAVKIHLTHHLSCIRSDHVMDGIYDFGKNIYKVKFNDEMTLEKDTHVTYIHMMNNSKYQNVFSI